MKKLASLALIIGATLHGYTQKANAQIEKRFLEFSRLIADKQIEKSLDYMNDSLFTLVPRESVLQLAGQLYNNPEMDLKLGDVKVISIDTVRRLGIYYYAKIKYSVVMKMKLNQFAYKADSSNKIQVDNEVSQVEQALKQEFGKDNVLFDAKTRYFIMKSQKIAIANSKDQVNWKFIVIEEEQLPILKKIIPNELLENH